MIDPGLIGYDKDPLIINHTIVNCPGNAIEIVNSREAIARSRCQRIPPDRLEECCSCVHAVAAESETTAAAATVAASSPRSAAMSDILGNVE